MNTRVLRTFLITMLLFGVALMFGVNVTGTVVSDFNPTEGLLGASVFLHNTGHGYNASTDNLGQFVITSVAVNQTYSYYISLWGFDPVSGSLTVGNSSVDMGTIIMNELNNPPTFVDSVPWDDNVIVYWGGPLEPEELTTYRVWRLHQGEEADEPSWVLITPIAVPDTMCADESWHTLPDGMYKWAVRAIAQNNSESIPTLSDVRQKINVNEGYIAGRVRDAETLLPIEGALVTTGGVSALTNVQGQYNLTLFPYDAYYDVSAYKENYNAQTIADVFVQQYVTTAVHFLLTPFSAADENTNQVSATSLTGCQPNPFSQSTTIRYQVKEPCSLSLKVYNIKGQLVNILKTEHAKAGQYQLIWDGKDADNNPVPRGLYFIRMQAGAYESTSRILLIK